MGSDYGLSHLDMARCNTYTPPALCPARRGNVVDPKRKSSSALLLRLDEMPKAGRTIRAALKPDEVSAFLPDAYRIDGSRGGEVNGHALLVDGNLHATATVTIAAAFDCSRCAEPSNGEWTAKIETLFIPAGKNGTKLGGDDLDDEPFDDIVEYQGRAVDLRPSLEQALAVALPPYPVCRQDCAGLCTECNINLNEKQCTCTRPVDPRWGPLAELLGSIQAEQEGDQNGSS